MTRCQTQNKAKKQVFNWNNDLDSEIIQAALYWLREQLRNWIDSGSHCKVCATSIHFVSFRIHRPSYFWTLNNRSLPLVNGSSQSCEPDHFHFQRKLLRNSWIHENTEACMHLVPVTSFMVESFSCILTAICNFLILSDKIPFQSE